MTIPVLMTVDEKFISQERVAIWSACKSAGKSVELDFTILCSSSLDSRSRKRLFEVESFFPNIRIAFKEIDDNDFSDSHSSGHIALASYYRLIASKVISADKCIYLDGDIIVECDLAKLFAEDIGDYYVCGAPDLSVVAHPNLAYTYSKDCNISNFSDYINCGVMVLNLRKIRNDGLVSAFLYEANNGNNIWLDQDVINRVCHGNIKRIDWGFNRLAAYDDDDYEMYYGKSKLSGRIIHWAGGQKPWEHSTLRFADEWWRTAKEALEIDEYKKMYEFVYRKTDEYFYDSILSIVNQENVIVIFGYSDHGADIVCKLRRHGYKGKIVFCDNDDYKRKISKDVAMVLSLDETINQYPDALYVNAVQRKRNEIDSLLRSNGIKHDRIRTYYAIRKVWSKQYNNLFSEYE